MKLLLLLPLCGIFSFTKASDKVIYNVKTQSGCTEVTSKPTRDCRWHADLDYFADQEITGCKIIAYKIQWFNGHWSNWFVTGINDIDGKINVYQRQCYNKGITIQQKTMRRWWSYFYDHNHRYIKCCPRKPVLITKKKLPFSPRRRINIVRYDESAEKEDENSLVDIIQRLSDSEEKDTQTELDEVEKDNDGNSLIDLAENLNTSEENASESELDEEMENDEKEESNFMMDLIQKLSKSEENDTQDEK